MEERAIYQTSDKDSSLRQGEILTSVIQYKPVVNKLLQEGEELSFNAVLHPYAIVVTQDCDLDWDYRARQTENSQPSKLLNSIILCEVATARETRDATDNINSAAWKLVVSHRHERYYFFEKIPPTCETEQEGLPELTADFKKVFCIDGETIYSHIKLGIVKRRAVLASPYLEHFSRRYHSFHGRVALPFQYESESEG